MRWFVRRLVFYVFAVWVAVTLNFLLPRLMPGDPIGGVLAHLSPAQIQSNPGIIQTYRDILGGGKGSFGSDYVKYLHHVATLDFGLSTSNYPSKVTEVIGRTLTATGSQPVRAFESLYDADREARARAREVIAALA